MSDEQTNLFAQSATLERAPAEPATTKPDFGTFNTDGWSLNAAREWLFSRVDDGGAGCPCCGQFAKVYWRKFNGEMARFVLALYRAYQAGQIWSHAFDDLGFRGGDYAKAQLWGLCELRQPNEDPTKRTSGMWKITDTGRAFASGELSLPTHVAVYNKVRCGERGAGLTIHAALPKGFDYAELMNQ